MYISNFEKIPAICIMGPTATGKTDLAIALADRISGEIISADSAMIYRGLDIGTAKPSLEIRQTIHHHLIDICDPNEIYTAGQFYHDAKRLIHKIHSRGNIALIVGGTMLYFHLLQNGIANLPSKDDEIRAKLKQQAQKKGWRVLHQMLEKIDTKTAQRIHPNDTQRIQRALEIYYTTGKTPTELYTKQKQDSLFDYHSIILFPSSKTSLYEHIETRLKKMLNDGLIQEVEMLLKEKKLSADLPALRTVGYRQIVQYLQGQYNYKTMVEKILFATKHLAKHQLTWLKRWKFASTFTKTSDDIKDLTEAMLALIENIYHEKPTHNLIEKNKKIS